MKFSGRKRKNGSFFRQIRTTQERRTNEDGTNKWIDGVWVDGRRRKLPNTWDDFIQRVERSWKDFRRQQWKEGK